MFKTFNRKKNAEGEDEKEPENVPIKSQKPPQPTSKPNLKQEQERINPLQNTHNKGDPTADSIVAEKPRRRKKNSKHRRTESKTFDKDFLQTLADNVPN